MNNPTRYDVIIIGGSYAGLAAAMGLGRALRQVLVIDSGKPCNRQTPFSHNFLTRDGIAPGDIAALAREQVAQYPGINFYNGLATDAAKTEMGFVVTVQDGEIFAADKLIIATGIKDLLPPIEGLEACWGISVLHCPYCHGYEVKNQATAILGNGDPAFEFTRLIYNWTKDLTLLTNGASTLSSLQLQQLQAHNIRVETRAIARLEHVNGQLKKLVFTDGAQLAVDALYAPSPFEQASDLATRLGCAFTPEGYIQADALQKTSVKGVYACGDATTRIRTVANAVAQGTTTAIMLNKELVEDRF